MDQFLYYLQLSIPTIIAPLFLLGIVIYICKGLKS